MDRNRKLQMAAALAPILSRIASHQGDHFLEPDVFRNVRSENVIVRASVIGWLQKLDLVRPEAGQYALLDRRGIQELASRMRKDPIRVMNEFVKNRAEAKAEDEARTAGREARKASRPEGEKRDPEIAGDEDVEEKQVTTEETAEDDGEENEGAPVARSEFPVDEAHLEDEIPLIQPVSVTLKDLEDMILGAGTRNKARFGLATMAVAEMVGHVESGAFKTRKELFHKVPSRADRAVLNESMAKAWQKAFLDRLEETGYAEKTISGRDNAYRIADGKVRDVIIMVAEAVHGDGLELKKVMWPGQYEQPEEEPAPSEEQARQDGGLEVLSELVGQLRSVAESMSAVSAAMGQVLEKLSAAETKVEEREARTEKFLSSIEQKLSSMVSRLESDERNAIQSIRDRVIDIQTRRKSLSNQLESEVSREEKILDDLSVLLTRRSP